MNKPNCYECEYRGDIPGDCHSICRHPSICKDDVSAALMTIMGHRLPAGVRLANDILNIKGNAHGIRSGWFCWPFNFDPVWLENCDGFKAKAVKE